MATTEPMLALSSGQRPAPRNLFNLGVLLGGLGGLMLTGGLVAAYFNLGHFTKPWPPRGVDVSNYDGTMLAVTMLMSSATIEWGIHSARKELRSQALAGFGLTIGLGLAFLNLLWFFGRRVGFSVDSSSFAVLLYTMLAVSGIAVLAGISLLITVLVRVLGQRAMGTDVEMARAAGWFWQSVVVGWIVIYSTVWLFS